MVNNFQFFFYNGVLESIVCYDEESYFFLFLGEDIVMVDFFEIKVNLMIVEVLEEGDYFEVILLKVLKFNSDLVDFVFISQVFNEVFLFYEIKFDEDVEVFENYVEK